MKYINKQRLILLCLIISFIFTMSLSYAKSAGRDISSSVFRLHIVANSDSSIDQALKLSVRDRILAETAHLFKDSKSAQESAKIAKANLDEICLIAQDEVKNHGFSYPVTAEVTMSAFPTKTYGNITLPSGRYTALKINIGEAKGKNWWCVMYPPLCLTDGILSYSEASREKLQSELSPEEYRLITKETSGAIPVEVRFKIVEIFQNIF